MATSQITSSYEGSWLSTQTPSQNIYTQNIVCLNEAIILHSCIFELLILSGRPTWVSLYKTCVFLFLNLLFEFLSLFTIYLPLYPWYFSVLPSPFSQKPKLGLIGRAVVTQIVPTYRRSYDLTGRIMPPSLYLSMANYYPSMYAK
jgi:hypothetical protein